MQLLTPRKWVELIGNYEIDLSTQPGSRGRSEAQYDELRPQRSGVQSGSDLSETDEPWRAILAKQ